MTEDLHVLVGLGVTAVSCARYLSQQHVPMAFADTRVNPPQLPHFQETYPDVLKVLGDVNHVIFDQASKLIVSPGVSIHEPFIARQQKKGTPVVGDIELFAQATNAPVIGITGTNAKSTVTTLVGKMLRRAGVKTQVGGNLGIPALDLITPEITDAYVLELSSFQLETTYSLKPKVAAVLNISPDHMDRYASVDDYRKAKHRVYQHCEIAVCNRDDPLTDPKGEYGQRKIQFTLQMPRDDEFGLLNKNGENFLAYENKILMPVRELPVLGRHYQANALAALAIGHAFGLSFSSMVETLIEFKGLEHRCELIRTRNGVRWYNDSKGTNVGATIAAIEGLGPDVPGKLILIAGGVGKNADFSTLISPVSNYVKHTILIGEAAPHLANVLKDHTDITHAHDMQAAVNIANELAQKGDSVLLSPACASFDMFNNFEHRGTVFKTLVQGLE